MSETTVLKVLLHCDGCVTKVKRYIRRLEGVKSFHVDRENSKVTVIGKVKPQVVLDQVLSAGKTAEFWPKQRIDEVGSGDKIPFNLTAVEGKKNTSEDPVETGSKRPAGLGSQGSANGSNGGNSAIVDEADIPELETAHDLEKKMLVGKSPLKKSSWAMRKPLL
ncbi:uncharacterized protein [Physcomitrium patens]|uniref:HMA domain-containing protein n=1 Tax=Physcomitrium patens TaxID=3218 RepID=A0A2K1JTV6_PHYPA|nr:heavy metal-associated isoprenylated plant protein 36-like isoform X2 [Physcomitrium patens]PNR44958.1 hypothetical protein PHYPA_014728 [Physcomitrium patens]|eukprot:XP_024388021.1 heavy metal-associated isoprenylated plant protein 36-like isoform X2 [Physcomitrella patens]